jgi:RNA polymerase sigma factor (sigma-70 family)
MEGERHPYKGNDMPANQMSAVISNLRRTVLMGDGTGLTDGQLLAEHVTRRNDAALATLVKRHGPMVWGVCRRVLSNDHDAEDAFQATFLVLVRKAAAITSPNLLANWLYGVAHQTALKARATTAKRKARERQVEVMPEPATSQQDVCNDLRPLLDQELSRLPEKYRVAIVLCDLEGRTRKEAARQLGVPDGTLAARVARGRVLLAERLARHGLAMSGGALGVNLSQNAASADVPSSVVWSTIKAASLLAAGHPAAVGLISAKVAALTEGVLRTMFLTRAKIAAVPLLVVGFIASAVTVGWPAGAAEQPAKTGANAKPAEQPPSDAPSWLQHLQERGWVLDFVDAHKDTISVSFDSTAGQIGRFVGGEGEKPGWFRREGVTGLSFLNLPVAESAKIIIDGETGTVAGLKAGMHLTIRFSPDKPIVAWLNAVSSRSGSVYVLTAIDVDKRTLSVTNSDRQVMKSLPLAKDAKIHEELINLDGGPAKTVNLKLMDLKPGMHLVLQLGIVDTELVIQDLRAGP